jgi:Carboxypeptidase regulatory-like domain
MNIGDFSRRMIFKYLAGLALAISASQFAAGQATSGNLVGTIFDPSGAAVPNATVTIRNNATGIENSTTSSSAGDYRFSNLPTGTYSLNASAAGFAPAKVDNVAIKINLTATTNVTLAVSQAATTVEVTTAGAAIDTSTAQIQTTFEARQLADLPSASGGQDNTGVLNLSLLSAGVTSSGGAGYGEGPSVGGQRPTNNNFTIEGIDNNNLAITGPIVTVPNDAVAEFSMLQNQFSPDFGHSSGGQFNQVVKSGTNGFHGALYEYFQNRNLNAADNLNAVEGNPLHPRYDVNRFGGYVGGPIKRNKLFFFVDYEFNPIGQTANTFYYAPTQTGYNILSSLPGINPNNLATFKKYLGTAGSVAPVSSLPNGSPVLIAPGPGSIQSQSTGVFAPGATGAISLPVGEVSSSLPNFINQEYGVGSVDYNISDKDSLRGRFILNRFGDEDYSGFPAVFFGVQPNNGYLATLSEYHTFSPTITNEFRLGYNRYNQQFPVFGNQSFPGLDQFPNIDIYELNAAYGPDPNAPQYTIQNIYQVADNLSWTKGKHSFKFGFDGWSTISPSQFIQRARGDYEWNYLNDYLYDSIPDGLAQRTLGHNSYYQNQLLLSWFGNDVWKITPNLTLNIGLRYEYLSVPLGENTQSLNASASVPGLITFHSPTSQKTNFMPRVGIAYSPGNSGRTSIRAGFGISYDVLYDNLGTLSQPPQLNNTVDVTGNTGTGFLAGGGIPPNTSLTVPEGLAARTLTSGYIPDQQRPKVYNWNFGIQHQFAGNYVFESMYTGNRAMYLPVQVQLNRQPTVTASTALPVYFTAPSQATLNSLTSTLPSVLAAYNNNGNNVPGYLNAGFTSPITAFMPWGDSTYNGWSNSLSRRFSNGLQFQGSYTWSHAIDNSTDAVNSTVLAPRRPQDFQNLSADKASSLLDHRNRVVFQMIYDMPFFKNRNWFMKNLVGNWEIAPVYIFETGEPVTIQSATDSNLNGDSAPDRAFINPAGNPNIGSGASPLTNSSGQIVAYLADNPNAGYVSAPRGTLPTAGRSTARLNPINDIDLTLIKRFTITERFKLEFSARAFNLFNHPQYTGGYLDDVYPIQNGGQGSSVGNIERAIIEPQSSTFLQWSQGFSSNPRMMQLAVKLFF